MSENSLGFIHKNTILNFFIHWTIWKNKNAVDQNSKLNHSIKTIESSLNKSRSLLKSEFRNLKKPQFIVDKVANIYDIEFKYN